MAEKILIHFSNRFANGTVANFVTTAPPYFSISRRKAGGTGVSNSSFFPVTG